MNIKFFSIPAKFEQWLEKNHDQVTELWVGFHKKNSGKKSITYPEALDLALIYGWIDGIRKTVDKTSYTTRFTPRRRKSNWSSVNTRRVKELMTLGLMKSSGIQAFEQRDPNKTALYSSENRDVELAEPLTKRFRAHKTAWNFFGQQPPGYQRRAIFWVMSAKQEETRERRLKQLMHDSAKGVRQGMITGGKKT